MSIHLILLIIAVVVISIFGTIGLVYLVRYHRRFYGAIQGTTDIEGIYVTVLGTLYAIFVSFMIFVVWSQYYSALNASDQEASTLVDIYELSKSLPQPLAGQLQQLCRTYAHVVIEDEWPAMARGKIDGRGGATVRRMWTILRSAGPKEVPDSVLRDHLLTSFMSLTAFRRYRLLQSSAGLPPILYIVLIFGGMLTIVFASVFSSERFFQHVLKAGVLAAMISLMLATIWLLDYPFQGDVHVHPDAFRGALQVIEHSD